jgi:glucokinase
MPGISLPMDRNPKFQEFFVGVDVGGTNIKTGVVSSTGRPLSNVVTPTEGFRGPEVGIETIKRSIVAAVEQSPIQMAHVAAIGLATPGTMDIPNGLWMEPANLPSWRYIPIRQIIADEFDKPTVLQNDANAAAFGEFWGGGAQKAHSLALWTLGTGVGCGLIINGQVVEGAHSHAGECGFLYLQMENGRPCVTGMKGTLEAYASVAGIIYRCKEALATGQHDSTIIATQVKQGASITPLMIAEAAEQGDPLGLQLVDDTARFMAYGTVNLMHTIDPDVVLFGGNVTFGRNESQLGRRFIQAIRDEIHNLAFPVPASKIRVDFAELGGDAGFIGAAGCAWSAFGVESQAVLRSRAS